VEGVEGRLRAREACLSFVSAGAPASARAAAAGKAAAARKAKANEALDVEKKLTNVLRLCAAGYLSKGYAQFGTSPLADPRLEAVRRKLRSLHPQPGDCTDDGSQVVTQPVPTPEELPNKEGVEAHCTSYESFCQVFAKPPQERGMSLDAVSYEDLQ